MKNTHNIAAVVSVGLMASLGGGAFAEGGGDPRVEMIEQPTETTEIGNFLFSDDGVVRLFHVYQGPNSDVYRYHDGQWALSRRELQTVVPGITPIGLSSDGSVMVLSDFLRTDVVVGNAVITMPRVWTYTDETDGYSEFVSGSVTGVRISDDGQVVTLAGRESGRIYTDSLVWFGGSELVNISDGLPREDGISYGAGIPSADGSMIAFGSTGSGDIEGIWVWNDGVRVQVPRLDAGSNGGHELRAISANGQAVFGVDFGPARGGLWYDENLTEQNKWTQPRYHAATSWIWTQQDGIVPIMDSNRFHETSVWDINDDGSIALIEARPLGSNDWGRYLWYGGDDFVLIDDLLGTLGIPGSINGYSFWQISGDGSKLMGAEYHDGRIFAVTVEIPVR